VMVVAGALPPAGADWIEGKAREGKVAAAEEPGAIGGRKLPRLGRADKQVGRVCLGWKGRERERGLSLDLALRGGEVRKNEAANESQNCPREDESEGRRRERAACFARKLLSCTGAVRAGGSGTAGTGRGGCGGRKAKVGLHVCLLELQQGAAGHGYQGRVC
jgi:hypothetical protein